MRYISLLVNNPLISRLSPIFSMNMGRGDQERINAFGTFYKKVRNFNKIDTQPRLRIHARKFGPCFVIKTRFLKLLLKWILVLMLSFISS